MNFYSFPLRTARLMAPALVLVGIATSSMATTLQVVAISNKATATFLIDGTRSDARVGYFTDEGLLLEKVGDGAAVFRLNGESQRMKVGEIAVFDSQTQGFISHQIRADQKNKYLTPALVNGGHLQAEIDRNADLIVIPVADADRLGLIYKDKPSRSFPIPKEPVDPKASKEVKEALAAKAAADARDAKDGKPATYKTYSIQLNSVRVGSIDLYGLRAVVTEKPGVTTTVIGRDFLKRISPSWSNRVLTLVRR